MNAPPEVWSLIRQLIDAKVEQARAEQKADDLHNKLANEMAKAKWPREEAP
jgi:long-subunit acyl-CoA synthetase (AMP-forming)